MLRSTSRRITVKTSAGFYPRLKLVSENLCLHASANWEAPTSFKPVAVVLFVITMHVLCILYCIIVLVCICHRHHPVHGSRGDCCGPERLRTSSWHLVARVHCGWDGNRETPLLWGTYNVWYLMLHHTMYVCTYVTLYTCIIIILVY